MRGDSTFGIIIAVVLALGCLFIIPLVSLEERVDDVTQQDVQRIIDEVVTETANTGVFTKDQYQALENKLAATGKTYDIEVETKILDENPGKKTSQANYTKIGENTYVEYYTTQVLSEIGVKVGNETVKNKDTYKLKPGDMITISVTSEDSAAKDIKSSFLNYSNAAEEIISASSSAMCTAYGAE